MDISRDELTIFLSIGTRHFDKHVTINMPELANGCFDSAVPDRSEEIKIQ